MISITIVVMTKKSLATSTSVSNTAKGFLGTQIMWLRTPVPNAVWKRTLTGAKTILVVKGRERAFPKN